MADKGLAPAPAAGYATAAATQPFPWPPGLELGPGALNLMGARLGANIVASKLDVNEDADNGLQGGNRVYNAFAALGEGSDSGSDEEDSSGSEREKAYVRPALVTPKQTQCKAAGAKGGASGKKKKKARTSGRNKKGRRG